MPPKKKALAKAQEKVISDITATIGMRETEIVFPEKDDMIFMGQNIFGHDFIHDFNSVSMADRLMKIQDEIRALVSSTGGSSVEGSEGLYTGGNADTEIVDLNDYMLNIPRLDHLREFSEEIARFSLRPNTRSKVKLLQDMESLTYELRLYHIGHINSTELSSGGAIQGSVKLGVNQYKDYSDSVRDGFRKIINIPENKRLRHFYISMFKLYLFLENTGVHPYKILNCSFIEQAMMVYLIDPRVFNESKQVYQVLHTIVSDSLHTSDQNPKKIGSRNGSNRNGSSRNRSSRNNSNVQQGGMSGGDGLILSELLVRSLVARIENPSDDSNVFRLLQFSRDGTEETRAVLRRIIKTDAGYSNVFEDIIHNYEQIFSNVVWYDNMGLGKLYTEIKRLNSVLPTMLEQVIRSRRKLYERTTVGIKRVMQEEIYISALSNVIINHIYEPLKNACNDLDIIEGLLRLSTPAPPALAAEAAAPPVQALPPVDAPEIARKIAEVNNTVNAEIAKGLRGLPADVKNTVQQISVCVAKGVLEYIGRGEPSHTHRLLRDETNILEEISNNSGFSVVDNNIITAFDRYVSTPSEHASKISYTRITDIIRDEPNKISINNAANKPMMDTLALTSSIVCPNSSIVDAMGIFGSCAGTDLPRETHNMGFTLTNSGRDYYYTGQSILKNNKLKIIYSSNINEFVLPYVQMEIDIKSTKFVTTLSANTTFKSVLNKITDIWINFGKNNPAARPADYWDKLFQNKTFFQELVSVGSLKSVGDLFQEINSTALNGSYMVPSTTAAQINDQLRIGIMGDRPSGVRAGFILYKAISGTHPKSIAGYFAAEPTRAVVLATTELIPSKGPAPSKKGPAPSKGPAKAAPAKSARKSAAASKAVEAPASKKTTTKRNRGETSPPVSNKKTAKKSAKSAK
jgi:hypothetical protein